MEKKNYRIWEYEWMVWKKAILDTIAFYQTNRLAAFGNVLGSLLTLFYVYIRGGVEVMKDQLLVIEATLFGFIGTAIFYILVHRMSAPVVLYRKKETEASRFNWDFIVIERTEIKDGETFRAHGIKMKNGKAYDLRKIIAQIQYLEIDGQPDIEERQLLQNQKGRRLGWLWNDHRMTVTEQSLDKNGGEAVIDLFRIMPNRFSFFEFYEERNDFIAKHIDVNNFTIMVDPKGKPKMIFDKGRIYKPPEIER